MNDYSRATPISDARNTTRPFASLSEALLGVDEVGGADDDDDEDKPKSDKKAGRRKIKIEFIQDKSRRHITFSKRKAGIMKKASPPVPFISLSSLLFFACPISSNCNNYINIFIILTIDASFLLIQHRPMSYPPSLALKSFSSSYQRQFSSIPSPPPNSNLSSLNLKARTSFKPASTLLMANSPLPCLSAPPSVVQPTQ